MVGYARVSTTGQSLDAQVRALKAAGATRVYSEKLSGSRTDRPQLHKLVSRLEPGDVVLVTRLDRAARSSRDLHNIIHAVAESGAGFRSLSEPLIDTTSPHGRLLTSILGALAEFERDLIMSRTGEGRERARAMGVKFGRPAKLTAFQRAEAVRRLAQGESQVDVARSYNVSQPTISRLVPPFGSRAG